jgi:hypothetical protein
MEEILPDAVQASLRLNGVLELNEIAVLVGDLVVAKSAIDSSKRVLGTKDNLLKESTGRKQILKG